MASKQGQLVRNEQALRKLPVASAWLAITHVMRAALHRHQ